MEALAERSKSHDYSQLFSEKPEYYATLFESEGLVLLIYENDTLKYWSDNSIAVENRREEVCLDTKIVKLYNGWFEVMRPNTNAYTSKTIVGLILLKSEYPYENKYLVNEFQNDFDLPAGTGLLINGEGDPNQIKNSDGEYLFSLVFNENSGTPISSYVSFLLTCLGFCMLLFSFKKFILFQQDRLGKNAALLLLFLTIVVFRYLSIKANEPKVFYDFDLFSPLIYADSSSVWLSSLGDLLINASLLFFIVYALVNDFSINNEKNNSQSSAGRFTFPLASYLLFYGFSAAITFVLKGLIINSNIPFGINNLYSLNQYTYIALLVFSILLFVSFLFADKLVEIVSASLTGKQSVILFVVASSLHALIWHLLGTRDLIYILWPTVLLLAIIIIRRREPSYYFSAIVFLVFIVTVFAVHLIIKQSGIRELETRKIYAKKLLVEQDPVTEYLFEDVANRIAKDSSWLRTFTYLENGATEYEKHVKQNYFGGFWDKYDINIMLFDSMCVPVVKPQNADYDNTLYFSKLVEDKGVATENEYLTFIKNTSGKVSYLAKFALPQSNNISSTPGTMYIELDAKFTSDEIGFPELLLDKNIGFSNALRKYSYARYKNNLLVNQLGDYAYPLYDTDFINGELYSEVQKDGLVHLVYRPDATTVIILSDKQKSLIDRVTTFSYLYTFFSVLLLSIILIRYSWRESLFDSLSFKYRIQLLLVFIVLVSLGLFGGGTIYYIKEQFEQKNKDNISDKIHSVLIDIDGKLSSENRLTGSMAEYSTYLLKKWSNVFFTDINLYDAEGSLYASSRPEVFDEGLTSKKMNPEAYYQMAVLGKKEFIHDEQIGKLEYLSAYHSFRNSEGKLLAFINLPYFAKQSQLEKEISGFLVALINIYVFLFALTILMAILISNYVTKPLKLIQDKLSKIKLGKTNELIEWQDKDEIGRLVNEYNRMIQELSKSAELLAKSERESAWREMAKQVAHEIKNPLTPMKLSVQHLQRIWRDKSPDMDQKLEGLTKTIIDQIDTLSTIATEFSNFAKMPKANMSEVNVNEVLLNSIELFSDTENTRIKFTNNENLTLIVNADKEQLLRVFNNVIKNSIQAIPEGRTGIIEVELKQEDGNCLIAISDNGVGIAPEVIEKVFTPNFTTKTGGTGLGLAMVKNIVESFGGKIWFENHAEEGCVFYISLPCISAA